MEQWDKFMVNKAQSHAQAQTHAQTYAQAQV